MDPHPSEQRQAQSSNSQQLGELSLRVLDHISAMVAYWDANQVCRFANQAYLQWFGKSREQLLGTSMRDLLGPLYYKNLPYILGALRGEPQVFERAIPTPSGVIRHSMATYTPDIVDGIVLGFFVHVSDVSPLKAAQKELEQAKQAAEDASRAKSEFLASMSHEIRTPLNAILGLAELLAHTPLAPQQSDYLGKIEGAGRSLLDIINEILDFSKIEAGKLPLTLRDFSLEDVLEELAGIVGATSDEKDLEIVFLIAPDVPRHLFGDPGRIKQVLLNLLRNAVKFTEQGEIVLEIMRAAESSDGSAQLRFSVRDTGIGIPAHQLEQIFEAFAQSDRSTTRSYGGTGLGLTISRRLVRMMGGELHVESTPGRGSAFHFTIPLGVRTPKIPPAAEAAALPEQLRVLAVCQSPLVSRFLAETCGSFCWELTTVDDISEAANILSLAGETEHPVQIVFINWPLRGDQAPELVRQIADMPDSLRPVVAFLVQSYMSSSLRGAVRLGQGAVVDEILKKPMSAAVVYRKVMRALVRRRQAPELRNRPQPRRAQSTAQRLQGLRLLLVDDNPINLEVASKLFTIEGASVHAVASGHAALAALGAAPASFDAVLMDVQMPEIDGYQTTCEIRRNPTLSALPVIAISAGVLWEERDKCRAAGMNGFISKPLELEEAVLLIDSLASRAARREETSGLAPVPTAVEPDVTTPRVQFDIRKALPSAGSDTAHHAHLLTIFLEDNVGMLSNTRSGLQRGDLKGIASALHRLRGSAATLGATRLASAALALERFLSRDDLASAHGELQEYEAALREALHAARDYLHSRR